MSLSKKVAKITSLEMNKKGQAIGVGQVSTYILMFVIVAFIGVIGMTLIGDLKSDQTVDSHAYNAADKVELGGAKIFAWFPTIGTIVGGAIVVGILALGFMAFMRR